jgi:hypothetical protein
MTKTCKFKTQEMMQARSRLKTSTFKRMNQMMNKEMKSEEDGNLKKVTLILKRA